MEGKPKESLGRYIPEEIAQNVFRNLRARPLLRFRCVSKQWQSWISEINITMPNIMSARSIWYDRVPRGDDGRRIPFQSIDPKTLVKNICFDGPKNLNFSWRGYLGYKEIRKLGSCDELILLLIDRELYLWNLSKGRYKKILWINDLIDSDTANFFWLAASGLCFDPKNPEFKAVLAFPSGKVVAVGLESMATEVIDFPSKIVKLEHPDYGNFFSVRSGPVVNKRLHWFVSDPSNQRILYFDPNAKVKFVDLPLPDGNFSIIGLGALDGCLCMSRRHQNGNSEDHVDVMGMKCYGDKDSWTVLFRMSRLERYYDELVPLVYAEKDDVVLMKEDSLIIAYNTKRRTRKVVCVSADAFVYEESFNKCNAYNHDWRGRYYYCNYK